MFWHEAEKLQKFPSHDKNLKANLQKIVIRDLYSYSKVEVVSLGFSVCICRRPGAEELRTCSLDWTWELQSVMSFLDLLRRGVGAVRKWHYLCVIGDCAGNE